MRLGSLSLVALATALCATSALADPLFSFTATVDGVTVTRSFDSADDAISAMDDATLQEMFPTYTDASTASGTLNFRGLDMTFAFTGDSLSFQIPDLAVDETFAGADRDASLNLLEDYVVEQDTLSDIQAELAASSPVDPVAGNPHSLLGLFAARGFDEDVGAGDAIDRAFDSGKRFAGLTSLGASYTTFESGGLGGTQTVLPAGLGLRLNTRTVVKWSLTAAISDVEGAESYAALTRLSAPTRLNDGWTLTPSLAYGLAGSEALGGASHMVDAGLASRYAHPLKGKATLVIGNTVGYAKTLALDVGSLNSDPGIASLYFKNGVALEVPMGKAATARLSYALTNFTGADLYIDHWHEVGVQMSGAKSPLSFEARYAFGPDYTATTVGAVLRF